MRIVFMTGCIEPGRDGVGDYTRRLAAECMRQGHPSIVLGLNEFHIHEPIVGSQEMEDTSISALRLPSAMPWTERVTLARVWLDEFNPDWASLQFVPFGFHPKGLPFGLAPHLLSIVGTRPLHWMFHELWVLWSFPLSLRKRLLGQCQKIWLRSCLRKVKPKAIATQLPVYQAELNTVGLIASVIPLHGNIPVHSKEAASKWLADRCGSSIPLKKTKVGFFGNILLMFDRSLFAARMARLNIREDELVVFSAGKLSKESASCWDSLQALKTSATFIKLGELNEQEASFYFSALDYGLTSYPIELMGKSGAVAAMREHGLRTISCGLLTRNSKGVKKSEGQNLESHGTWTVTQSAFALLQQLKLSNL